MILLIQNSIWKQILLTMSLVLTSTVNVVLRLTWTLVKTFFLFFFHIVIRLNTSIEMIPIYWRAFVCNIYFCHWFRNLFCDFSFFLFPKGYILTTNHNILFTLINRIHHLLSSKCLWISLRRHLVEWLRIGSKLVYLDLILGVARRFSRRLRTWFWLLTSFINPNTRQLGGILLLIKVPLDSIVLFSPPIPQRLAICLILYQVIRRSWL